VLVNLHVKSTHVTPTGRSLPPDSPCLKPHAGHRPQRRRRRSRATLTLAPPSAPPVSARRGRHLRYNQTEPSHRVCTLLHASASTPHLPPKGFPLALSSWRFSR
jgi:hypothetical protein